MKISLKKFFDVNSQFSEYKSQERYEPKKNMMDKGKGYDCTSGYDKKDFGGKNEKRKKKY